MFVVWEMKRNVSVVCVCSAPNCCDTEQRSASQPGSVASGTLCMSQDRQCTCNETLWRANVLNYCCNGSATMHYWCVVELNVHVIYIEILSVAQQWLYGKFMSPATIKRYVCKYSVRCCIEANVRFLMAFFRRRLAEGVVTIDKSLRSCSVSVKCCLTHCTTSHGINQLWSNKH